MKLLYNAYERQQIIQYSGKWGFKIPNKVHGIVQGYQLLRLKHLISKRVYAYQIVEWLSNKLK